jgi:transcriptional regulator with XRE-family HTH domain
MDSRLAYMPRTKKVASATARHFQTVFSRWVDAEFEGNHTAAGRMLGMTQGHVSALYNGDRGPGLSLLLLLREKTGQDFSFWLGLKPIGEAPAATPVLDTIREAVRAELAAIRAEEARAPLEEEPDPPTPPPVARPVRKRGSA